MMAREKSPEAFRTIREIAEELVLPQHVLRFWEQRFTQIAPVKRAGGRRYYRPEDIALIRRIKGLLHDEGYTIKGVQKLLLDEAASPLLQQKRSRQAQPDITKHPAEKDLFVADSIAIPRDRLQAILDGLIALRSQLGQNDER